MDAASQEEKVLYLLSRRVVLEKEPTVGALPPSPSPARSPHAHAALIG